MSAGEAGALRLIAFGDLEGLIWGAAIDAGEPAVVLGARGGTGGGAGDGAVALSAEGEDWRLTGEHCDLLITPIPDPGGGDETGGPTAPAEQLCAVSGTISVSGGEQAVQCPGVRSAVPFASDELDSVRAVAGWFSSERGLALQAQRPSRHRGHEDDRITATLFDPEAWVAVQDPRLSTTLSADGAPTRTSLELWIGSGEDEFPRRAAGEAVAGGAEVHGDRLALRVTPLRCHAGGLAGAGVYVLARLG